MEKYADLVPGNTYHIYNRANGNEKMFLSFENYRFFLRRYQHYISPVAETFCYCLLSNHFHFVIRLRAEPVLQEYYAGLRALKRESDVQGFKNLGRLSAGARVSAQELEKLISKSFSNLFNSYTKALNKSKGRKGSLFMQNFKRKLVEDDCYLLNLIHYVHFNPSTVRSGKDLKKWPFSSFHAFLSDGESLVQTKKILEIFGGRKNFLEFHESPPEDFLHDEAFRG